MLFVYNIFIILIFDVEMNWEMKNLWVMVSIIRLLEMQSWDTNILQEFMLIYWRIAGFCLSGTPKINLYLKWMKKINHKKDCKV